MKWQDFEPSPPLQHVVERYWGGEDADVPAAAPATPVLPSPVQPVLVVLRQAAGCGGSSAMPPADAGWVIGQAMHHGQGLHLPERGAVFGVLFRPCGFYQLLGVNVAEAADLPASADCAAGRFGRALAQQVRAVATHAQRVAAAEELMLTELRRREPQVSVVRALIASVLERDGQVSVDELSREARLSRRQLERRFREAVGVPPKLFAEMNRFAHVFRLLHAQPVANWLDLTYGCGYFDQAHFIREFRRFTGKTPSAYFAQLPPEG